MSTSVSNFIQAPDFRTPAKTHGRELTSEPPGSPFTVSVLRICDCPKFATCNAPVCPLGGDWRRTRHLRGERTCLYLREGAKPGGEARIRALLPPELADPILEAYRELVTSQQCTGANGFSDLLRKLQAASTCGSKLEAGDKLKKGLRPGAT